MSPPTPRPQPALAFQGPVTQGWDQTTRPEKGPLFPWKVTRLSGSPGIEDNWCCCRRVLMPPVQTRLAPHSPAHGSPT